MDINDAFLLLNISNTADIKEIKKAYHKLCSKYHPDKLKNNDGELQRNLNEAYNIILAFKQALIPIDINKKIESIENQLVAFNFKDETNSYIKFLGDKKTIQLRQIKYALWVITAMIGFFVFMGKEIIPTLDISKPVESNLKILTLILGAFGLYFQFLQDKIKNKIEFLNDKYQDTRTCAIELSRLLDFKALKSFNTNKLYSSFENDDVIFLILFGRITYSERIKILILKSKEVGLIEQSKAHKFKPEMLDMYSLKFNPQDFLNYKKDFDLKSEPKPSTLEDLKTEFMSSFSAFFVFSAITASVFYFCKNYWTLLPGFVSLCCAVACFTAINKLREFRQRNTAEILPKNK